MHYLLYFGHVNLDILLRVEELASVGESRGVVDYEYRWGGTAYNAYRTLKNLGVPVKIFSVIGRDIEEELDGYFVRDEKNPTCWIMSDGREQMAYIYQGKWRKEEELKIDLRVIDNFQWLHFSTGNPDFYLKIAKYAKYRGKKIGFDPSQEIHYLYDEEKFVNMLSYADIFFGNEREYEKAVKYAGDRLFEKVVVRTEGERGASIYIPDRGWIRKGGFKREPVDTTGAGDSFRAGFYAALYRGYDFEKALEIANMVASFVVGSKKSYYEGSWDEIMASMRKKI